MRNSRQVPTGLVLVARRPLSRSRAGVVVIAAIVTMLASAAVCVAAVLAPAPPLALPLVVAICVGCPLFACWELPPAVACLRAERARRTAGKALAQLRRRLEQLPEVEHPLGY